VTDKLVVPIDKISHALTQCRMHGFGRMHLIPEHMLVAVEGCGTTFCLRAHQAVATSAALPEKGFHI